MNFFIGEQQLCIRLNTNEKMINKNILVSKLKNK